MPPKAILLCREKILTSQTKVQRIAIKFESELINLFRGV